MCWSRSLSQTLKKSLLETLFRENADLVRRKGFKACEATAYLTGLIFRTIVREPEELSFSQLAAKGGLNLFPFERYKWTVCIKLSRQIWRKVLRSWNSETFADFLFAVPYPKTNTWCVWQGIYSLYSCIYFNLIWSFCHHT